MSHTSKQIPCDRIQDDQLRTIYQVNTGNMNQITPRMIAARSVLNNFVSNLRAYFGFRYIFYVFLNRMHRKS